MTAPTPPGLLRWLASSDLDEPGDHPGGHCLSWWNPTHPGYPYPEISGLLLRFLSLAAAAPARRQRLRAALLAEHATHRAVRRAGQAYTFDLAMALGGLTTDLHSPAIAGPAASSTDPDAAGALARDWATMLIAAAEQRNPLAGSPPPGPPDCDTRWSLAFGAHQAKLCGPLLAAGRLFGSLPGLADAVTTCATAALAVQEDDGRFRIHPASPLTYAHSHCYAVEGLLLRAAAKPESGGGVPGEAVAGADWLARVQEPDGGVRAWHGPGGPDGPAHTDATAQAMRIWLLTGPDRFAGPIERARTFLTSVWVPPRGLRYEPGSADLCSWATIFAAQALSWAGSPAAADAALIV